MIVLRLYHYFIDPEFGVMNARVHLKIMQEKTIVSSTEVMVNPLFNSVFLRDSVVKRLKLEQDLSEIVATLHFFVCVNDSSHRKS